MSRSERDDRALEALFARQREADGARRPDFDALLDRRAEPAPRRWLFVAAATAAASISLVALAFWQADEPAELAESTLTIDDVAAFLGEADSIRLPIQDPPAVELPEPKIVEAITRRTKAVEPIPVPQSHLGELEVRVVDDESHPLPGAIVTLFHETGEVTPSSTPTDKTGVAVFPGLRTGSGYVTDVQFPGFGTRREANVRVAGDRTVKVVSLSTALVESVAVVARESVVDLKATASTTQFSDDYIGDLPVQGNAYQNTLTLAPGASDSSLHGSRARDFRTVVSGVSNVDPLTGKFLSNVNPNSIEEMEVITGKASVAMKGAQRGFANVVNEPIDAAPGGEGYLPVVENDFLNVAAEPLSTFSIDVDTASYANVRRFLSNGQMPPADAVRIEELINYFDYDYPAPRGNRPFSVNLELGDCPWKSEHLLARIGLQADWIPRSETAGSNLVFLIDVSGSMNQVDKLPLLKRSLTMLTESLTGKDRVAIAVYAGAAGLVLDSVSGDDKAAILRALDRLSAGGGTAGGQGIRLAYQVARDNFIENGVNRVILATDGDFNVGATGHTELLEIIQADADRGIALTALGFGTGNLQDGRLEQLADKGNGNYAYIDSIHEARKVLVDELEGTLFTVAKDVKIQVEFNPAQVAGYRLIGYENRKLANQDFNDDTKDAGEIGSGHSVTALYEIVPVGQPLPRPGVDALKYQEPAEMSEASRSGEWMTVKLRYKRPTGERSRLIEETIKGEPLARGATSADFDFAASVAAFGMLLRDSQHRGEIDGAALRELASRGATRDRYGYRAEFEALLDRAIELRSQ